MKIKVDWEIVNGYCGGSRPQQLIIETNDYFDNDEEYVILTEKEKEEFIEGRVQEDFQDKVSYVIRKIE